MSLEVVLGGILGLLIIVAEWLWNTPKEFWAFLVGWLLLRYLVLSPLWQATEDIAQITKQVAEITERLDAMESEIQNLAYDLENRRPPYG